MRAGLLLAILSTASLAQQPLKQITVGPKADFQTMREALAHAPAEGAILRIAPASIVKSSVSLPPTSISSAPGSSPRTSS